MGIRVAPAIAARLIAESLVPRLGLIELTAADTIEVLCASARVRVCVGGRSRRSYIRFPAFESRT
jgi:hypothetical protein